MAFAFKMLLFLLFMYALFIWLVACQPLRWLQ